MAELNAVTGYLNVVEYWAISPHLFQFLMIKMMQHLSKYHFLQLHIITCWEGSLNLLSELARTTTVTDMNCNVLTAMEQPWPA
jgi:hypothetical protein